MMSANNNTVLEVQSPISSAQNPISSLQNSSNTNSTSSSILPKLIGMTKNSQDNKFLITASYFKIIASLYGILFNYITCNQHLKIWLFMMMIYDVMYITSRAIKSEYQTIENKNDGSQISSEKNNSTNEDSRIMISEENNEVTYETKQVREVTLKAVVLDLMNRTLPWYYFLLFFLGNCIIFSPISDCSIEAPHLKNLVGLFLAFQYINIAMPVLLCFSILFICTWSVGKLFCKLICNCRRRSKNKTLVNKLKMMRYPVSLEGDTECSICMNQYEQGDEIVELECSKMHHFHAHCIKKWLKVDGICPMCRTSLQEMKDKSKQKFMHSKNV